MFDIGASELLIIAVVAILVIGPKDMPLALRTAGRWIGQIRKVSAHFRAGIDAMVRVALDAFGRVDVLVNNAGIARDRLALRMTLADWDAVVTTNLTAAFTCARAVLRPMLKQRSGRIISVGSVVGQMGNAGQVNYAASKAGLVGFSKALAREVASRGITVNVVAPGMIETDMTAALGESAHSAMLTQIPLGRLGTADEVAAAVCFLASDESAYITGHVLAVNGGMYM